MKRTLQFAALFFCFFMAGGSTGSNLRGQCPPPGDLLVQPPSSTRPAWAYCYFCDGLSCYPTECYLYFANGFYSQTGGHYHGGFPHPASTVEPMFGWAPIWGLELTITSTRVGQWEWIAACPQYGCCGCSDLYVQHTDLWWLPTSPNYVFVGDKPWHPYNHYAAPNLYNGIQTVAADYRISYPQYEVIALNDSALPWGGVFDLNQNWLPPHHQHDRGTAVDVRGNGGPNSIPRIQAVQNDFMRMCTDAGATDVRHRDPGTSNEHFHCEWPNS